jgi:hypothetical protein
MLLRVLTNEGNSRAKGTQSPHSPSTDEIAALADSGADLSCFFTGKGKTMPPIQSVNVGLALPRLQDSGSAARSAVAASIAKSSGRLATRSSWVN